MMEKHLIKEIIVEYQQIVTTMAFIHRDYVFEKKMNYVFVGLRRAGKSYLMYQQIHNLLQAGHQKEEILYFNFEDDRIFSMTVDDLDTIKRAYEELYEHKPIFFLDEIQIVPHWEKFARRLADQGYRVYITGSNAQMLSSEIATTLGGRFMVQAVFPFSFAEFLKAKQMEITHKNALIKFKHKIIKLYERYFSYGGLPELTGIFDKRAWLSNLYQKIFFGDLITRYQIRNDFALRILVRKLAESIKQPSSFNRLAHLVSTAGKKISTDTTIDYLYYLQQTWMIFAVENICAKLTDKAKNKKYYFADNGLLNLFLTDPHTALLENQVALELHRRYGNEVYFYRNGIEIDFYVLAKKMAIQVAYSLQNPETKKREIEALHKVAKHLEVKRALIITYEEEAVIKEKGLSIEVIPVWKWLLGTTHFSPTLTKKKRPVRRIIKSRETPR